jgi:hypothetical protein
MQCSKTESLMCLMNMQDVKKALVSSDVILFLSFYASGQIIFLNTLQMLNIRKFTPSTLITYITNKCHP